MATFEQNFEQMKWFDRKFPNLDDNELMPTLIERLAQTPRRIEEIIRAASRELLVLKPDGKWSILEEIGHLGDLESLWIGRVDDFQNGLAELRAADLTNQKTHTANHNAQTAEFLTELFRQQRAVFLEKLQKLTDLDLQKTALHPRLKTPMRLVDHCNFVAEHDDHHLEHVRILIGQDGV